MPHFPGTKPIVRKIMLHPRFTAVILAAGFSSRMGDFKPLLPLGGRIALERCVSVFRAAGVEDVRVVTGHCRTRLTPLLRSMNLREIVNDHPEQGMFSSVRAGLVDLLHQRNAPNAKTTPACCFLQPADIASCRASTIRALIRHWTTRNTDAPVLVPRFFGRTGHPALFSAKVLLDVLEWGGPNGLHGWMDEYLPHGPECLDVADNGVLLDMDHPRDVRIIETRLHRTLDLSIPAPLECLALHRLYDPNPARRSIHVHCLAVARVTVRLGLALLHAGQRLSLEAAVSAALVHDVARGRPGHAREGAEFLMNQGFPAVARMVAHHHDLLASPATRLDETALLRLADMLVLGDRLAGLDKRFAATRRRFQNDAHALQAIDKKQKAAQDLQDCAAQILGQDPQAVAETSVVENAFLVEGFEP